MNTSITATLVLTGVVLLVVQDQGAADGTPIVQDTCPANGDPTRAFTFVE